MLGLFVLMLAACAQSPEAQKQKALERGETYLRKGQYNEAIIEFRNALQVDPDFVPALHAWMLLATLICVMGAVVSAIWLPRDRVSRVTATSSVPPPAGVARFDATD